MYYTCDIYIYLYCALCFVKCLLYSIVDVTGTNSIYYCFVSRKLSLRQQQMDDRRRQNMNNEYGRGDRAESVAEEG